LLELYPSSSVIRDFGQFIRFWLKSWKDQQKITGKIKKFSKKQSSYRQSRETKTLNFYRTRVRATALLMKTMKIKSMKTKSMEGRKRKMGIWRLTSIEVWT